MARRGFDDFMSDADALMWNIEQDPLLRSTIVTALFLDRTPVVGRGAHPARAGRPAHPPDAPARGRARVRPRHARRGPTTRTSTSSTTPAGCATPTPTERPLVYDLAAHGRDGGLRPRPAAVGVHARRGPPRRAGRVRDEGPPLDDRRRRRDQAAAHAVRPRARPAAGRARPGAAAAARVHADGGRAAPRRPPARRSCTTRSRRAAPDRVRPRERAAPQRARRDRQRRCGRSPRRCASSPRRPRPTSPLLRARSLGRRVFSLDLPLDDLKRAAKAIGVSLNDAFVGGVIGGLQRYHEEHGVERPTSCA